MKAYVGSTIISNSYEAGVDIYKNATKGIKVPKVGLLFSSTKYKSDELLKGIKESNSEIKVIGCTSSGAVMTPDGIISNENGYAGMLVLEDNELVVGIAASERGDDPRETGRKIAAAAMRDANKKFAPTAFAMFATPGDEEEYLKGVQDELGEIPMFGGGASDDKMSGDCQILCDLETYDNGCAIVIFYSSKKIKNILDGTYNETNKIGVITKIDDNKKIVEIDNEPALKKYAEWIGVDLNDLLGDKLMNYSIRYPFGIKNIQGDIVAVKQPLFGNEDLSLTINTKAVEKTALILLESDEDDMIGGAVKTIKELTKDNKPSALILIHSAYRKICIGERIDEDFVAIKNAIGDIPFIVLFSSTEYGQNNHSGAIVGGLSLSFTSFVEQDK